MIDADGAPLELVLVKNPAAFTVALGTRRPAGGDDGRDQRQRRRRRDVSWLYDVSFASLRAGGWRSPPVSGRTTWPCGCSMTTSRSRRSSPTWRRGWTASSRTPGRPATDLLHLHGDDGLRLLLQTRYGLANFGEGQTCGAGVRGDTQLLIAH